MANQENATELFWDWCDSHGISILTGKVTWGHTGRAIVEPLYDVAECNVHIETCEDYSSSPDSYTYSIVRGVQETKAFRSELRDVTLALADYGEHTYRDKIHYLSLGDSLEARTRAAMRLFRDAWKKVEGDGRQDEFKQVIPFIKLAEAMCCAPTTINVKDIIDKRGAELIERAMRNVPDNFPDNLKHLPDDYKKYNLEYGKFIIYANWSCLKKSCYESLNPTIEKPAKKSNKDYDEER